MLNKISDFLRSIFIAFLLFIQFQRLIQLEYSLIALNPLKSGLTLVLLGLAIRKQTLRNSNQTSIVSRLVLLFKGKVACVAILKNVILNKARLLIFWQSSRLLKIRLMGDIKMS
jgi:hypothetical protein